MQVTLERWEASGKGSAPLAWFRPDPRIPLIPVWRISVLLLLLGAGLCGWFFVHIDEDPIHYLLLGLCSVSVGMLTMVRAALKVLADERCIGLFKEGLIVRDLYAQRVRLAWHEIVGIEVNSESQQLMIARTISDKTQEVISIEMIFMPIEANTLKALLLECVRRDGLGVALKLEILLDQFGVNAGLPSEKD